MPTNKQTFFSILAREFYQRAPALVAYELLGKLLVREEGGQRVSGIIIECEAYDGEQDQACHARSGRTKRNAPMYGPPGHAYIYFTYGIHWLLNCVTGAEGYPAAVLVRALLPVEGLETIAQRRGKAARKDWCNGPAKLTKALAIDGALNTADLCSGKSGLYICEGVKMLPEQVQTSPRVGINYADEPWRSMPWRFSTTIRAEDLPPELYGKN